MILRNPFETSSSRQVIRPRLVFISYRREEDHHAAGQIADHLRLSFSKTRIFLDDDLQGGDHFPTVLNNALAHSAVLIVVIGQNWLASPRLRDKNDWVRIEVKTGLETKRCSVIPVLIDGVTVEQLVQCASLPAELDELRHQQAIRLGNGSERRASLRELRHGVRSEFGLIRHRLVPSWAKGWLSLRVGRVVAAALALLAATGTSAIGWNASLSSETIVTATTILSDDLTEQSDTISERLRNIPGGHSSVWVSSDCGTPPKPLLDFGLHEASEIETLDPEPTPTRLNLAGSIVAAASQTQAQLEAFGSSRKVVDENRSDGTTLWVIVLISRPDECGGDFASVEDEISRLGIDLRLNIVGSGLDEDDIAGLKRQVCSLPGSRLLEAEDKENARTIVQQIAGAGFVDELVVLQEESDQTRTSLDNTSQILSNGVADRDTIHRSLDGSAGRIREFDRRLSFYEDYSEDPGFTETYSLHSEQLRLVEEWSQVLRRIADAGAGSGRAFQLADVADDYAEWAFESASRSDRSINDLKERVAELDEINKCND